jgi:hypothetical protein
VEVVASLKKTLAESAKGKVLSGQYPQLLLLAFPCFRCARLSRWCIKLLGVLQGIPRELVSLLAEFVIG